MSAEITSTEGFVQELFGRVARNIGALLAQSFEVSSMKSETNTTRAVGADLIHISFKLALSRGEERGHGCLLVPLPEAITLAGHLLMEPESVIAEARERSELEPELMEAMQDLGSFIGGAAEEVFRELGSEDVSVRSEGCQGVRPDCAPSFPYEEGDDLIVGRAQARINESPAFEMLLMLPRAGWVN